MLSLWKIRKGTSKRRLTGRWGEFVAGIYLRMCGANVRYRNVRMRRGEVDLVITWRGTLRAVEVRTTTTNYLDPLEAYDLRKHRQHSRLAAQLGPRLGATEAVHCDVIAIRLTQWGWPRSIRWLRDVQ